MDSVIESCLLGKKATIHSRIQRFGPQTTSSICRGLNTEWTEADFPKVEAELERLAEELEIAKTERGWVLDTSILAPEANRRYTLESHRIQVARQVAYEMGLEGKPEVVWRALSRRVAELTNEKVHPSWFSSSRGSHFREYIEAAFADGAIEREKRIDAVATELGGIVEEVTSATNGNGHHMEDDGPTEEDLSLVEEVAKLEVAIEEYQDRIKALEAQLAATAWVSGDVEEYQNKIAALEAQLAASVPTQVQTPQEDAGDTLEGILAALETQLEAADLKAEAAAKAVEDARAEAELAELEVDQARQRLQAALEAVNTLQSLKEGE